MIGTPQAEKRYSPAICTSCESKPKKFSKK